MADVKTESTPLQLVSMTSMSLRHDKIVDDAFAIAMLDIITKRTMRCLTLTKKSSHNQRRLQKKMSLREIILLVCGLLTATKAKNNYLLICDIGQKLVIHMPMESNANKSITGWNEINGARIYAVAVDMRNGDLVWEDLHNKRIVWGEKTVAYDGHAVSVAIDCCKERIFWSDHEQILTWDGKSQSYKTMYNSSIYTKSMGDTEVRQLTFDCLRKRIYWVEHHITLRYSRIRRTDYHGYIIGTVLTGLAETNGMTIDYETYTLYIMTVYTKTLYALPLKLLERTIPSSNPAYSQYTSTDLKPYLRGEVFMDIVVKEGYVYLGGFNFGLPLQRYNISTGPKSMKRYRVSVTFHRISTLDFYDDEYFDKYINSTCSKPTDSPNTTDGPNTTAGSNTTNGSNTTDVPMMTTSSAFRLQSTVYTVIVVAYIVCINGHLIAS